MKKFSVFVISAFFMLQAGCSSSPAAPDFARNPPRSDTMLYGVGFASMKDQYMAEQAAEARARVAISRQVNSMVHNMIDDYGATDGEQKEAFFRNVTRILSEAKLEGSGPKSTAGGQGKDGKYYAWVLIEMKKPDQKVADALDREKLNYAEFKNWNAQKEMDAAFKKQAEGNTPVIDKDEQP